VGREQTQVLGNTQGSEQAYLTFVFLVGNPSVSEAEGVIDKKMGGHFKKKLPRKERQTDACVERRVTLN